MTTAKQIAAALKWISDIAASLHHSGLNWVNATVYNYRVPQLEALAADYEARGKQIERLQNATACGLCGKTEPYILHLCEDCTDYGHSNTPKESFTMMREIERLKAELQQHNECLKAVAEACEIAFHGLAPFDYENSNANQSGIKVQLDAQEAGLNTAEYIRQKMGNALAAIKNVKGEEVR